MTFKIPNPNFTSIYSIYIDRITVISGSILNSMIFILLFRVLYIKRKNIKFRRRVEVMNITAVMVAFTNAIFCIANSCIEFGLIPFAHCRPIDAATASMWVVAKLFLYLFFLLRIDVVFRDSHYGLSAQNLTVWYVLILVAVTSDLTIVALYWQIKEQTVRDISFCSPNSPIFVYANAIGWDVILSCSLIVLFVSKIRNAELKVQGSVESASKNKGLDRLIKFSFLGGTAVASTLILISMVAATQWNFPASIDSMVNSFMMYLTYDKQHRRILNFVKVTCRCFIVCCCPMYFLNRSNSTTEFDSPYTPRTRTITSTNPNEDGNNSKGNDDDGFDDDREKTPNLKPINNNVATPIEMNLAQHIVDQGQTTVTPNSPTLTN